MLLVDTSAWIEVFRKPTRIDIAQVGDLVGPAVQGGELTTVSTINPIKVYYTINEQAYINFMRRFSSEAAGLAEARALEVPFLSGRIVDQAGLLSSAASAVVVSWSPGASGSWPIRRARSRALTGSSDSCVPRLVRQPRPHAVRRHRAREP